MDRTVHSYAYPGSFTIDLTVVDDDGGCILAFDNYRMKPEVTTGQDTGSIGLNRTNVISPYSLGAIGEVRCGELVLWL